MSFKLNRPVTPLVPHPGEPRTAQESVDLGQRKQARVHLEEMAARLFPSIVRIADPGEDTALLCAAAFEAAVRIHERAEEWVETGR